MHEDLESWTIATFPYTVQVHVELNFWRYVEWLEENVGVHWVDWDINTSRGPGHIMWYNFEFKHEDDKVKFILRWV